MYIIGAMRYLARCSNSVASPNNTYSAKFAVQTSAHINQSLPPNLIPQSVCT